MKSRGGGEVCDVYPGTLSESCRGLGLQRYESFEPVALPNPGIRSALTQNNKARLPIRDSL